MQTRHVFTSIPGQEELLVEELKRVFPTSHHEVLRRGWVESELSAAGFARTPIVCFALQALPLAERVRAASISAWARLIAEWIIERLTQCVAPFRLHVFCVEEAGAEVRARRCALIAESVHEILRRRQKRLLVHEMRDFSLPFDNREHLFQVGLETPTTGFRSHASPVVRAEFGQSLSRFPGGYLEIPIDRAPPSRAYLKLLEAEMRLGSFISAGERCVDLGSAPGGWSYIALKRGASVTAVDRSPLRADLMRHPALHYVQGDGFSYSPPEPPVDWLLCDIVAFPPRIIELIGRWLKQKWCRRFCVTVKFRGATDYPLLEELKQILTHRAKEFELRRLLHNKNEVTAYGFTE